jgi:adenylate cyclase
VHRSRLRLLGGALIEATDGPLSGRATQRHRLALLALLASDPSRRTGSGGLSREKLAAYLWPEADAERARKLLADSIYRVNQALGDDAIVSIGDLLRLDPIVLPIDVAEFEDALERGEIEKALSVYDGPFLDGFFLPDAPEFDRWMDAERARYARSYAQALETLAERSTAAGHRTRALDCWRRVAEHDPYNSRTALRLMEALESAGDRAGAIRHARIHETLLREELGAEPDEDVMELMRRLQAGGLARSTGSPAAESAGVTAVLSPGASEPRTIGALEETVAPPPRRPARRALLIVAIALPALIIAALVIRGDSVTDSADSSTTLPAVSPSRASVAVLPFVNVSPDRENEYFSDGMTEELINTLATVEGLRVSSRTSAFAFKGRAIDVRDVGRQLGVAAVLEGSVRRAGNRMRLTAQLTSTRDGFVLWSGTYDRELSDVFEVQDAVAREIVVALEPSLGATPASRLTTAPRGTADLVAYDRYLEGRYAWSLRGESNLRRAIALFEAAIAKDSLFARGWAGLALSNAILPVYSGRIGADSVRAVALRAAERALALDSALADAHLALGQAYHGQLDWAKSERHYRMALAREPSNAAAHQWYADMLYARGRAIDALPLMRRAAELDPLSANILSDLAYVFSQLERFGEAIATARRAIALDSTLTFGRLVLARNLQSIGAHDNALRVLDSVARRDSGDIVLGELALAYGLAGHRARAESLLTTLRRGHAAGRVQAHALASAYAGLAMHDSAAAMLERSIAAKEGILAGTSIPCDPAWRSLQANARYRQLLRAAGLQRCARS